MQFLNTIKAVFSSTADHGPGVTASATEYVDWLPNYMLRQPNPEMRLDTSRPLPGGADAPGIPDSTAVVNRLKVLCGINPFRLTEPAEGKFVREHGNHKLRFSVAFDDRDDRSICTLRLSIRA